MDLDYRGIDHRVFHVRLIRACLEKSYENIGFDPISVTLEGCVPVAEKARQVPPRTTCPRDPQHGFNEAAVVASTTAGVCSLTQTVRFHLRPLGVRQNNPSIPNSFRSLITCQSNGNPESQQALGQKNNDFSRAHFACRAREADAVRELFPDLLVSRNSNRKKTWA
jgi:hypothetical protein